MKGPLVLLACIAAIRMTSQNEVEALRYSFYPNSVSARSAGMGGSFGALGADFSSFFNNPGGIGQFKRGGIELGFVVHDQSTESSYMGQTASNAATRFGIQNFGIVGTQKTKNSDWSTVNFGFAYAKTMNYTRNISIEGTAVATSLLDVFALQAAGTHPDDVTDFFPFGAGLAYQTYGIDPIDSEGVSYAPAVTSSVVKQQKNITRTGYMGNTSIAFGSSYRDLFSIGMAVNFVSTRFRERAVYTENYEEDQNIQYMSMDENLSSNGTGINLKIGAIYKPTEWLRIGSAFHTRTYLSLRETYKAGMDTRLDPGSSYSYTSPELVTDYSVRTPSRLQINTAFILGKSGVISADYEYADYGKIRMNGTGLENDYNYEAENKTIGTIYRGTHRVGAGVELRVAESYYTRFGASYQQSPFVNDVAENSPWITYSAGIGFKKDHFYADFATMYSDRRESYYLYNPSLVEETKIKNSLLNMFISVGLKY